MHALHIWIAYWIFRAIRLQSISWDSSSFPLPVSSLCYKSFKDRQIFCHRTFHPVTMIGCCHIILFSNLGNSEYPVGIYLFKRNNRNTRTMSEICSKSTIMTKGNCCNCDLNKYLPAEYLPKLNNYCFFGVHLKLQQMHCYQRKT